MRKFYCILLSLLILQCGFSQRTVILEQFRTFSMVGPVMSYLNHADTRRTVVQQLNDQLLKHKNATLADTSLRIFRLPDLKNITNSTAPFTASDTSAWHMYLDLYEFETNTFYFSQPEYEEDSLLFRRTASVFQLGILLTNSSKEIMLNEVMTICVTRGNSSGFGILAATPSLGHKGFTDMLNLSIGRLLDPENKIGMIEVKAAPVFYADNFILPEIQQSPVIQVTTKKDIASFRIDNTDEIIRMGEPFYEQLITKGKNKNVDDSSIIGRIISKTERQSSSDFVQLRQENRDVVRDKNYTLKMFIEINPYFNYLNESEAFTSFIHEKIHSLQLNGDTIAKFIITKNLGFADRKIYLNKVSNGYDSTSVFTFEEKDIVRNLFCEYQITGTIRDKSFYIRCYDKNMLKEFIYDHKRIAIARGQFLPERIAVFDASLDKELLNQLMIIGFSRFFR